MIAQPPDDLPTRTWSAGCRLAALLAVAAAAGGFAEDARAASDAMLEQLDGEARAEAREDALALADDDPLGGGGAVEVITDIWGRLSDRQVEWMNSLDDEEFKQQAALLEDGEWSQFQRSFMLARRDAIPQPGSWREWFASLEVKRDGYCSRDFGCRRPRQPGPGEGLLALSDGRPSTPEAGQPIYISGKGWVWENRAMDGSVVSQIPVPAQHLHVSVGDHLVGSSDYQHRTSSWSPPAYLRQAARR